MSEVHRAHDGRLKRDVAVKVLPDVFGRGVQHVSRFAPEAERLAALGHPNLAATNAIDDYEGRPFIAMALLTSRTLLVLIDGPALSTNRLVELALEIADRLGCLHVFAARFRIGSPGGCYRAHRATCRNWHSVVHDVRSRSGAMRRCQERFSLGAVLYEMTPVTF
jgi:hypothetical protein